MIKNALIAASLLPVLLLFHACSSGGGASTWKDPAYTGEPFRKVMVFVRAEQLENRRRFENSIMSELQERGYAVVMSISILSPEVKKRYEGLEADLEQEGIDAILVAEPLGSKDLEEQTEGSTYYEMYSNYHDTRTMRRTGQAVPGTVTKIGTLYHTRTTLYQNRDDRLVWQTDFDLTYYGDWDATAREFASLVAGYIDGSGLLSSGRR
jgi:hypothetical protein